MKTIKVMKHTTLILIFLGIFSISQAQVFESAPPSSTTPPSSTEGYKPFSSGDRPRRAIDPGDTGDPFDQTGGKDDEANVNDNNIPVRDGVWLVMLVALGYVIYVARVKKQRMKNNIHTKY